MKLTARLSALTLALIALTGCILSSHYGAYDGAESPGWVLYENEGASIYRPPHYRQDDPDVSFYSDRPGHLYFRVSNLVTGARAVFRGSKISVLVQGVAERSEFEANEECNLTVPHDRDFTVVVPAFDVGPKKLPELKARFHWSDRKVRESKAIFGS